MIKTFLLPIITLTLFANEPISPIPTKVEFNLEKARLGKKLFFDTILSKDNSTACVSCHNVFHGGADSNVVSSGYANKKGNIQSPTVLNSRYNFKQFWNGRARNLTQQADGPINNPAEHNMDAKTVEDRINDSTEYKRLFESVYSTSHISYTQVLEAIVEFENSLTTPNSKFDRFLRDEIQLTKDEKEGYILFKQNGCITCHNGINVGGNSFQKMGTFLEYEVKNDYPDRSKITDNPNHKNVFKVPTLRNISQTAPYFHDGSAKTLKEALSVMAKHNLGIKLEDEEVDKIIAFLKTLDGDLPEILEEK
ncbi:Cytochrome-c peroxidase [Sulfurimonas gotlandica GD1]|uniref:Cytochrome-c peroxidase n=1 Tax=Sulfurimonas gotlandica (strain DSM 19862 / JCM 16533 / GD1) TaxID=929558 RepID=B6BGA0_SULGG|nr:cytochrome c peroxidase [Sulfurimonas gotlandica]EDZ63391.1 cytochrome c551 peroxidase [Sulfurimonas gotlandica GD1]EHP29525.1 Cytochrome-c peroxidase [Sulfurimonas gotlandica GD1]